MDRCCWISLARQLAFLPLALAVCAVNECGQPRRVGIDVVSVYDWHDRTP